RLRQSLCGVPSGAIPSLAAETCLRRQPHLVWPAFVVHEFAIGDISPLNAWPSLTSWTRLRFVAAMTRMSRRSVRSAMPRHSDGAFPSGATRVVTVRWCADARSVFRRAEAWRTGQTSSVDRPGVKAGFRFQRSSVEHVDG